MVAVLRMDESRVLNNMVQIASRAEQRALFLRSWSALLSVLAVLQSRLATDTLLPGTVRNEETDYYAHVQAASFTAKNELVPAQAVLQTYGSNIGYIVLVNALYTSLNFMFVCFQPLWPPAQRKVVESFVRAGVGVLLTVSSPLASDAFSGVPSPGRHSSDCWLVWMRHF